MIFNINTDALVVINGSNQLLAPAHTIEQLLGGAGHDRFIFQNGATFSSPEGATLIDGGSGNNTLDYSAYTSSVQVNLAEALATGVDKILHIQNVIGGFGNDILIGDSSDNILAGGPGDDILQGGQGNDRYVFTADWGNDSIIENANGGSDTLDFSSINVPMVFTINADSINIIDGSNTFDYSGNNIENFIGGTQDDIFRFAAGAKINGSIDGQGGNDTLDFSAYASARQIILTALGTIDGFSGTTDALGQNGFNNINNVIGSDAGDAKDTLIGRNAVARFYLADGIYESENTLHFSGFEVLQGGSAEDTFIFNDNTNFAGSLNGGNGIDTLDYSACTIPATINLQTFTTTGITGNFTAIEAVLGSSGNDTLIGSDKGAVFTMISSGHGSVTVPGITGGVFTFTALENIQGGTGMDTLLCRLPGSCHRKS